MTDYGEAGPGHRTTYGHFLSKKKWDDGRLEETQKHESFRTAAELAQTNKTPVFVSVDGTVLSKTKPSLKAKRPMQGAGWHYSHPEGKATCGHQIHAAMAGTGETSLSYSLEQKPTVSSTRMEDVSLRQTLHPLLTLAVFTL